MQPVTPTATRYDRGTIWLHWLTLALVAFQWVSANVIDDFAKGESRMIARSVHISAGVVFLVLIVCRVLWRISGGRRLPPADHRKALHLAANAVHWGLYLLLAATLALGLLTVWAQGDSIFGLFSLPMMRPHHPHWGHQMQSIHGTLVNLVLILAAVHAAAALGHWVVWRDSVLARMLTFLPRPPRADRAASLNDSRP
jgi:cytochrome b561